MQSKKDLEQWYETEDPWGYETNPEDLFRKNMILKHLGYYDRALDIGAGEGWITKDLPANTIHAIEISDLAASRFPKGITRVAKPQGKYGLVVANGVLYPQYDWEAMHKMILEASNGIILITSILEWEKPLPLTPIQEERWRYRDYTQTLKLYENFT